VVVAKDSVLLQSSTAQIYELASEAVFDLFAACDAGA
jgi:hypothetical protein